MTTITRGQSAPAGWEITLGGVSGVCQADICEIAQSSTPVSMPAPTTPALKPAPAAAMMGQPAQPQICTPEGCSLAPQNLAGSASAVLFPQEQLGFNTNSGADPYDVWRAQSLLGGLRAPSRRNVTYADPNKSAAVASVASSQQRANDLMSQGVDYATAVAMAQREALDQNGYRAAGIASGATPAATSRIDKAAQLEAEQQYLRGGTPSDAGMNLFAASPGILFMDSTGNLYKSNTSGAPETVNFSEAASKNPLAPASLLSGQRGLPLQQATAAATEAGKLKQTLAKVEAQGVVRRDVQQLKNISALAVANARLSKNSLGAPKGMDLAEVQAAAAEYEKLPASEKAIIPYNAFLNGWHKEVTKRGTTAAGAAQTSITNPAAQNVFK